MKYVGSKLLNKAAGTAFEQWLALELFKAGWWVHQLQQSSSGQPADLLAFKRGREPLLIDCKLCQRYFSVNERIEDNQWMAMAEYQKRTGMKAWFAIRNMPDCSVWFIGYDQMVQYQKDKVKSLSLDRIAADGIPLEKMK